MHNHSSVKDEFEFNCRTNDLYESLLELFVISIKPVSVMTDILADVTCYIGLFCLRVVNIIQRREVIGHNLLSNGHICAPVTMYLSKVSYCGVSTAHWLGEAMLLLAVNISRHHWECALLCCLRRDHYFTHVSGSDTSLWTHSVWQTWRVHRGKWL